MGTRKTSVNMKDVAALAKVSLGTVSNVVNTPELVIEATRARVQVAIDKLGWVPNESARQPELVVRRSTLGVAGGSGARLRTCRNGGRRCGTLTG